jgi:hypothetical protein
MRRRKSPEPLWSRFPCYPWLRSPFDTAMLLTLARITRIMSWESGDSLIILCVVGSSSGGAEAESASGRGWLEAGVASGSLLLEVSLAFNRSSKASSLPSRRRTSVLWLSERNDVSRKRMLPTAVLHTDSLGIFSFRDRYRRGRWFYSGRTLAPYDRTLAAEISTGK